MSDRLIEWNKASAKRQGWTPGDFGARGWTDLAGKVREFQRDHFIEPANGKVTQETYLALQGYRQGLKDGKPDLEKEKGLKRIGDVSIYDPDDPQVTRSEPFTGRTLFLANEDLDLDLDPFIERVDRISVSLSLVRRFYNVPILVRFSPSLIRPWEDGRALARTILDLETEPAGVIVELNQDAAFHFFADGGTLMLNFLDALQNKWDGPRAISTVIGVRPLRRGKDELLGWAACARFDAALPIVPGPYGGSPPEYTVGQTVSEWSIFGKLRPSFCFPVIVPEAHTTANYIHRIRDWIHNRRIRGQGWDGPLDSPLLEAFLEKLPDEIDRVDYNLE